MAQLESDPLGPRFAYILANVLSHSYFSVSPEDMNYTEAPFYVFASSQRQTEARNTNQATEMYVRLHCLGLNTFYFYPSHAFLCFIDGGRQ